MISKRVAFPPATIKLVIRNWCEYNGIVTVDLWITRLKSVALKTHPHTSFNVSHGIEILTLKPVSGFALKLRLLPRWRWLGLLGCWYGLALPLAAAAQESPAELVGIEIQPPETGVRPDFHRDILPFLKRSCLACHNASTADAEVVLESPDTMLSYDPDDPLIVPGDANQGKLLRVAAHLDEPTMPPDENDVGAKPLTPIELGLLHRWIELGANAGSQSSGETPFAWQPPPADYQPILATAITDQGRLAICGRGNSLEVYDLVRGSRVARLVDPRLGAAHDGFSAAAHLDLVRAIATWNEGEWIASGGYRTVKLWRRLREPSVVELPISAAPRVLAVADAGTFAVGDVAGGVVLRQVQPGETSLPILPASQGAGVLALEFSNDRSRLVSVAADGFVRDWNVAAGEPLAVWKLAVPPRLAVILSDQLLVTASEDRVARLWKLERATAAGDGGGTEAGQPMPASAALPADHASSQVEPVALKSALEFRGHTREISVIARIPGASPTFVSGSIDGTVRRWDLETGQQTNEWVHGMTVQAIAVSPDGTRIVSAGNDGMAKHWVVDVEQPQLEQPIDFRSAHQRDHLQQNIEIATSNVDVASKSLEAARKQLTTDQETHQQALQTLAAADATFAEQDAAAKEVRARHELAVAAAAKAAKLTTLAEQTLQAAREFAESFANSGGKEPPAAEQPLLATAAGLVAGAAKESEQAAARVEAIAKEVAQASKVQDTARAARDDSQLAVRRGEAAIEASQQVVDRAAAYREGMVQTRAECEQQFATWQEVTNRQPDVVAAEFSADGTHLLFATASGQVSLFDGQSGLPLDAWQTRTDQGATLVAAQFAATNRFITLRAGGEPPQLEVWGTEPAWRLEGSIGSPTDPLSPLTDRVLALDFSFDGSRLAIGGGQASRSGQLVLWNRNEHRIEAEIDQPHTDAVLAVAFSRDGKYLASGSADRMLKVFRVPGFEFERLFEGHSHHVLDVAWRANGLQLATCSGDKTIKIWDLATGAQIRTILGGGKELTGVDYLGIGGELVSASGDRTVRIHNTDDGKQTRAFTVGTDYLHTCAATESGDTIVTGGADRVLRVFVSSDGTERFAFESEAATQTPAAPPENLSESR